MPDVDEAVGSNKAELAQAIDYARRHCIAESSLAAAVGITAIELDELRQRGVIPCATYRIHAGGFASAVAVLGEVSGRANSYFAPSVIHWLRRAAIVVRHVPGDLIVALQKWLADDLRQTLVQRASEASSYGWGHVVGGDGVIVEAALADEVRQLWQDWMNGGWAICLRRFDGHHIVSKEIERQRIAQLIKSAEPHASNGTELVRLFDAMERLDAVILPFAPHERKNGTPGQFIDRVASRHGLPWAPLEELPH